jgi:hypothetical protein
MKLAVLLMGVVAWLGVAIIAVLVVNAWADDNQVAAFFPIAAAVAVAWLIGEWVTERVFLPENSGEVRHGSA